VISGTPRMNSMKTTQIHLMIGMSDCRPSASTMPIGSDSDTQTTPRIMLSMKPPMSRGFRHRSRVAFRAPIGRDDEPDCPPDQTSRDAAAEEARGKARRHQRGKAR
jgi:hypothetical protein